jgi:maltooligosyltrehalose trehalohydrolase
MVVFSQNHDQIGNRMLGERLSHLIDFESLKLAAGVLLLSPFIPLLFMGEEYGETAPFLYFVSHSDPGLIEAVREGRKEEFKEFTWQEAPPDPQSLQTFLNSKIHWEERENEDHKILLNFYRNLITLRREIPALSNLDKESLEVCGFEDEKVLLMKRWIKISHVLCIFNFNRSEVKMAPYVYSGKWGKLLDSADRLWHGPGALLTEKISGGQGITIPARSLAVYRQEEV